MVNLDDKNSYLIDKEDIIGSILALPDQAKDAFEQASLVDVPNSYQNYKSIVMCGMGGSGLGGRVIESVYADEIKAPLVRINEYDLPSFVDENCLVICSSYSSETEETVSNARQAIEKKAKWMAIGTSGTLINLAKENSVPYYEIDPKFNPSKHPRMALGYSIIGQLVLASKSGLFNISQDEVNRSTETMTKIISGNKPEIKTQQNRAKQIALELFEKATVLIASRHLFGSAHAFKNQLNENAKHFSCLFDLPELNHHLLEGLLKPSNNPQNLIVMLFESSLYPEKIKKRYEVTKEIINKYEIKNISYVLTSGEQLLEAFELIQFASFINYYLAIAYQINPGPIPWVDFFKQRLGQSLGKWK